MLGCSHPVVMAFTVAIASKPPAAPRQCPIIDWNKTNTITEHQSDNGKENQCITSLNLEEEQRKHALEERLP